MAIVQTLNTFSSFYDAIFERRKDQFSVRAWEAIYDYLEALSDDMGEDIEFDCISVCCEYVEYESIEDFVNEYDFEFSGDDLTEEEQISEIEDYVNKNTTVIGVDPDCILFAIF